MQASPTAAEDVLVRIHSQQVPVCVFVGTFDRSNGCYQGCPRCSRRPTGIALLFTPRALTIELYLAKRILGRLQLGCRRHLHLPSFLEFLRHRALIPVRGSLRL